MTIPRHAVLRVGTLAAILADVAAYLELDRQALADQLPPVGAAARRA